MEKLLTIIVPSYNMETYLPKCLESLIVAKSELLSKIEVLVVNDGSKDRTSEIAHAFANKYSGVFQVIDKDNGHYGSCVNVGLRLATGEFVKILDADDTYDNKRFEEWIRLLLKNVEDGWFKDVQLLLTDYIEVDSEGEQLRYRKIAANPDIVGHIADIPRHYVFQMHAVAYRTSMLRRLNYTQTEGIMYTDTEWSVYPMEGVVKYYYWPHPVYRYLVDRIGQSMDAEVFNRCVWQRVKMYMRMMRESLLLCHAEAQRHRMRFQALFGLRALYLSGMRISFREFNTRIRRIDELVKEYGSDVYMQFDAIPLSREIPYRIIKAWRRKHRIGLSGYCSVRLIVAILCILAPVKNRLRALLMKVR